MSAKKAILHPDVLIDLQPHSPAEPGWYGPKLRLLFDERDPLLGAMLRQNNNARGIVVRWADVPQVDYFAFAGVIGRRAVFERVQLPEGAPEFENAPEGQLSCGHWPQERSEEYRPGDRPHLVWWPKSG